MINSAQIPLAAICIFEESPTQIRGGVNAAGAWNMGRRRCSCVRELRRWQFEQRFDAYTDAYSDTYSDPHSATETHYRDHAIIRNRVFRQSLGDQGGARRPLSSHPAL
jgi:hypothetical protein